jgi:uridine phosphorylase
MIQSSELILNPDGSVYHLNFKPRKYCARYHLVGDQIVEKKSPIFLIVLNFQLKKENSKPKPEFFKGKALP